MLHVLIITVKCKMLEGETSMSWPGISTYKSSTFQEYDKTKINEMNGKFHSMISFDSLTYVIY